MAALHPAETALRQATIAANQAMAERTAPVHYDTSKVTVATCNNHQAGRRSACQVVVRLVGISVRLEDSNISCHK